MYFCISIKKIIAYLKCILFKYVYEINTFILKYIYIYIICKTYENIYKY
jgi:hypothetical protein